MDVVAQGPLPVASLLWQSRPGTWALTVICKATFLLVPTEAQLAPEQDPIVEQDEHWDDDETRSLRAASDIVPLKPRADVVLVGMAFAPEARPVRSLVARMIVGDIDKSIEVFCDRAFTLDGALQEGPRFTRMSLRYERAGGGPETWNPAGMRPDARDRQGRIAVPNLQPLDKVVNSPGDLLTPVGFGPIAARWPSRQQKLGRHAGRWSPTDLARAPAPEDIEIAYYQVAPPDQQVDALRDNERIVLDNLHPKHAHLVTSLPGLRPKAVLSGREGGPRVIPMRADTLVIDTERAAIVVTWRAQIPLRSAQEEGRVTVSLEHAEKEPLPREEMGKTTAFVRDEEGPATLPFKATSPDAVVTFAPAPPRSPLDRPPSEGTVAIDPGELPSPAAALPFAATTPQSPVPQGPKPPALIFATPAPEPAPAASPWASGVPQVPPPEAPGTVVHARAPEPIVAARKTIGEAVVEGGLPVAVAAGSATPAVEAPGFAVAPSANGGMSPSDALLLVWLDRKTMPRVVRKRAWQEILDAREEEPIDPEFDDPALFKDPAEMEDRAEAHVILGRAAAVSFEGLLDAAMRAAKKAHAIPPLEVCEGELSLPFDPIEALKTTAATARPFAAGKEALSAAVQEAEGFIGSPGYQNAPGLAERFTRNIREAYALSAHGLGGDDLDVLVARALCEGRHYQRRRVLGGNHLRALLRAPGERHPLVVYLPAAIADDLPLFGQFPARVLGEVHFAVDPEEKLPIALRAVALGRVVRLPQA
ncbi:DUF2169 domain-containing protein [Polyangium sp. y55x31]|uniref:DUF2169 family type VI secretion system accessory protein n=1 Tax=Polyangium sp. y55x31 TaxID=3042688 RepID=UPI00248239BC|nr:DUF2169 domain-containing protein [Polyangium sp. y55x31]MDI1484039.1 DUF2169 domain-containing protein [Polyangium sp. y55x31]